MDSYGPLSSEAYGLWFPEKEYEDADFYRSYLENGDAPALEVGCGDGRLLIPFVKEGFKVEGVDLSSHMLEQCRRRAKKKQVEVTLYEQAMQHLSLPKKYGTIFIPYGSFMLVSDMSDVKRALNTFYQHLLPKGHLIIPLFIPNQTDIHQEAAVADTWRLRREGERADGTLIRCWEKAQFDQEKQREHAEYRYEVLENGAVKATEEEVLELQWHTQTQFRDHLENAGFQEIKCFKAYSRDPASPEDSEFVFVGRK